VCCRARRGTEEGRRKRRREGKSRLSESHCWLRKSEKEEIKGTYMTARETSSHRGAIE